MRMYPREYPSGRRRKPKRRSERHVYEALANSNRRGSVYYEWRRGHERIELHFAVSIEELGRFALQVKGGRYLISDGEWRLATRDGVQPIAASPLDETELLVLGLHDDIPERASALYNPYAIPALSFPVLAPDVSRVVCGLSEKKSFGLSGSRIGQSRDPPIRRLSSRQEAVEPRQTTMEPNPCVCWRRLVVTPNPLENRTARTAMCAARGEPNGDRNPKTVRSSIHHHRPEYSNTKQR